MSSSARRRRWRIFRKAGDESTGRSARVMAVPAGSVRRPPRRKVDRRSQMLGTGGYLDAIGVVCPAMKQRGAAKGKPSKVAAYCSFISATEPVKMSCRRSIMVSPRRSGSKPPAARGQASFRRTIAAGAGGLSNTIYVSPGGSPNARVGDGAVSAAVARRPSSCHRVRSGSGKWGCWCPPWVTFRLA